MKKKKDLLLIEAGDRQLHTIKQFVNYADRLPQRVLRKELEEEVE